MGDVSNNAMELTFFNTKTLGLYDTQMTGRPPTNYILPRPNKLGTRPGWVSSFEDSLKCGWFAYQLLLVFLEAQQDIEIPVHHPV